MIAEIASHQLDPAPGTLHAHGYHLEYRRLPGPARSKYPHYLVLRDCEADAADLLLSFDLCPPLRIRVVIRRIGLSHPLHNDLVSLARWPHLR